jgi:hypothetical protein
MRSRQESAVADLATITNSTTFTTTTTTTTTATTTTTTTTPTTTTTTTTTSTKKLVPWDRVKNHAQCAKKNKNSAGTLAVKERHTPLAAIGGIEG